MKRGRSDKTNIFGSSGERYIASLFQLAQHPNGHRRPDLVSVNGRYKPRLTLEVKSGKKKGVMNEWQLHYAVTTYEDYKTLFGEEFPEMDIPELGLPGIDWSGAAPALKEESVAYYYCVLDRVDEVTSNDLDVTNLAAVRFKYGDHFIVPHQFGFVSFAVVKHFRMQKRGEHKSLDEIKAELNASIKQDVLERCSHYMERRATTDGWQDLHAGISWLSITTMKVWQLTKE